MDGLVIATAFKMGIVSACSLPPGAITALFRKPGDRVAAALVAFGGGALLAALTLASSHRPESLVIGASLTNHEVSLALIASLFLSNYPEALFSSISMRQQGISVTRVIFMWTSLMVLTGVGAAPGSLFFIGAGHHSLSLLEGLAAGAMLTMIAQTILPDAYFKGGSIIGLATLTGFLTALFIKSLSPGERGPRGERHPVQLIAPGGKAATPLVCYAQSGRMAKHHSAIYALQ